MKIPQRILYRVSDTLDPEERCEDAALAKALYDAFGGQLELIGHDAALPAEGWLYGARRQTEPSPPLPYWDDPAFLEHARRTFMVRDLDAARKAVEVLHGTGQDAFVKSTRCKHFAKAVPVGNPLLAALNGLEYDFCHEGSPRLMVQGFATMRYEWRFLAIGRRIVAESPNAAHLTPIDFPLIRIRPDEVNDPPRAQTLAFGTPGDRAPTRCRNADAIRLSLAMVAVQIAATMQGEDAVIDCAEIGGKPGCVELNPMVPGQVGLFASDVRAFARAIVEAHPRLALPLTEARVPAREYRWVDPVEEEV